MMTVQNGPPSAKEWKARMSKFWVIGLGFVAILVGFVAYGTLTGISGDGDGDAPANKVIAALQDAVPDLTSGATLAKIAPHKALYKIEMVEKRSGAQVLNISGEMYFEWKPVCGAWTTDHRFSLLYEYAETPPMRITSDFTTYERFSGDSFDFNSRRRRDGEVYEELRGHAAIKKNDAGSADFNLPAGLRFDLPAGTLFPMAHTVSVVRAAEQGKKFLNATIFDGSDAEGPSEVNAFIGKKVDAMARITPSGAIAPSLINTPAWNVRLAFFPLKSTEADSDYEMDVVMHENGVISDMYVEYKDFSVTQRLVALERLTGETCDTAVAPPVAPDDSGKKPQPK